MMRIVILVLLSFSLGGCALFIAGAAGVGWEAHRNWCIQHYGNPNCYRRLPVDFQ